MISKNLMKYVRSLEQKKIRCRENVFIAEGPKVVGDLLANGNAKRLIALSSWYERVGLSPRECDVVVSSDELRSISLLQHPQEVMGLFPIANDVDENILLDNQLFLALDGVQDPGNMGTIIRIADWFGIETIFCSNDTADVYNPKVVQASMGSIARVKVKYVNLQEFIDHLPKGFPIYGTFLDGQNIYEQSLTPNGLIIMGNEGKGVSRSVAEKVTHRLFIPNFPPSRETADSLNVAIATAIVCAEFRRIR